MPQQKWWCEYWQDEIAANVFLQFEKLWLFIFLKIFTAWRTTTMALIAGVCVCECVCKWQPKQEDAGEFGR